MKPETKKDLRNVGLISGLTGAALLVGYWTLPWPPPARPVPRLEWENTGGATVTVVESRASAHAGEWTVETRLTNQNWWPLSTRPRARFYRVGHPTNAPGHWWDPEQGRYRQD